MAQQQQQHIFFFIIRLILVYVGYWGEEKKEKFFWAMYVYDMLLLYSFRFAIVSAFYFIINHDLTRFIFTNKR